MAAEASGDSPKPLSSIDEMTAPVVMRLTNPPLSFIHYTMLGLPFECMFPLIQWELSTSFRFGNSSPAGATLPAQGW